MLRIPGSLRSLLANLIDYAGLYPPAGLPLPIVAERYQCFLASPESWILNRLVLPAASLAKRPSASAGGSPCWWTRSRGPCRRQVETLETKDVHRLSLPTYCEAPLDRIEGRFRQDPHRRTDTGRDSFPRALAAFLCEAAARRIPFKATAGLHHPLRSSHALTYASDSPQRGRCTAFSMCSRPRPSPGTAWRPMASRRFWKRLAPTRSNFDEDQLCWRQRGPHDRPDCGRPPRLRAQFRLLLIRGAGLRIARVGPAAMIDHTHDPELRELGGIRQSSGQRFPDPESAVRHVPYTPGRVAAAGRGDRRPDSECHLRIPVGIDGDCHGHAARRSGWNCAAASAAFWPSTTNRAEAFLVPMSRRANCCCRAASATIPISTRRFIMRRNVGSMFRPDNPLLPNYKWVPVGYHGRASSVVVSGTPVRRPCGPDWRSSRPVRRRTVPAAGWITNSRSGPFSGRGMRWATLSRSTQAGDHLFGVCLLNDWSARDIQAWEYQPLGPFLAKNFATSVSPWVVTAEALEPSDALRRRARQGDPQPLPHLQRRRTPAYDISSKSGCARRE